MESKWKDWLKLGFIGYLLALPVLIWNSSKIGKAISLFLLVLVSVFFLNFLGDWGIKIYLKFTVINKIKPVIQKIDSLDKDVDIIRNKIGFLELSIKASLNARLDELETKYRGLSVNKEEQLKGIENSLELLKETERQAVKDRIIEIKEQVKVFNKSVDSKEIRKQLELVAQNLYLLTSDEKDRFMKDLEDIGFQVKVAKKEANYIIYTAESNQRIVSGWSNMTASGCVVY